MKLSLIPLLLLAAFLPSIGASADSDLLAQAEATFGDVGALPYALIEVDQPPALINQTPPRYPVELKAAKISGEALIEFVVDKTGAARAVQCLRQTDPRFGDSAITAVQQWRFHPATKDGLNVACRLKVPIVFSTPQ